MESDELKAAAERLRRMAYAECDEDSWQHADDCKILAHAYLALGERLPDHHCLSVDGRLWLSTLAETRDAVERFRKTGHSVPGAKVVRVITFTQEVQE